MPTASSNSQAESWWRKRSIRGSRVEMSRYSRRDAIFALPLRGALEAQILLDGHLGTWGARHHRFALLIWLEQRIRQRQF